MDITNYSKIDHKTLHFLPFLPSRTRKKGFVLTRKYGDWTLDISARETLNIYDLLTLLYIVKEYLANGYNAGGFIGTNEEDEEKKEIAGIKLDVKKFLLTRGVLNKKTNRQTLKNSIKRLKTIDLTFTNEKKKKETNTSYIYEFVVDADINTITIYANKRFIDFVVTNGILINLERLKSYGNKEQYPILLDLYLQGTKIITKKRNKTKYIYRAKFSNKEIEQVLKLDLTNNRKCDKKQIIKKTFELLHEKGNMPLYTHDEINDIWIKKFDEN